ncbi:hypothetical protein ACIQZO_35075 [Streptomyces sp. NPDC097617]|uniref:hypothetical protein n=1 Tax=Streptomyces sp. NPDC097617 TaxID=3366091 RepID=UPI0037FFF8F5
MSDNTPRTYVERLASSSPLAAAAFALNRLGSGSERNVEILALRDRAGLVAVHTTEDFDPHFAEPDADSAICGLAVYRVLNAEQFGRISVLCRNCESAAIARLA